MIPLAQRIELVEKSAYSASGLVYELYRARVQAGYGAILDSVPEDERDTTLAELKARGYDPDEKGYEPAPGECHTTGLPEYCCPCGRHP